MYCKKKNLVASATETPVSYQFAILILFTPGRRRLASLSTGNVPASAGLFSLGIPAACPVFLLVSTFLFLCSRYRMFLLSFQSPYQLFVF